MSPRGLHRQSSTNWPMRSPKRWSPRNFVPAWTMPAPASRFSAAPKQRPILRNRTRPTAQSSTSQAWESRRNKPSPFKCDACGARRKSGLLQWLRSPFFTTIESSRRALLLHLQRILDVVELGEFRVPQLAVDLLDLANVDRLHDVARVRIDRHHPARAFPFHALHGGDQAVAVGLALGLLQRLVDEVHAVIAADRYEVRTEVVRLLEVLDVFLVERGIVRGGIIMRGDHPQHLIAHIVELVVVGEVARADDLDPGTGQAALGELLGENARLRAGEVDEGGIGVEVADTLQERRKVRIGQRNADRFDDLAAELGEALLECGLRFGARRPLV